MKKFDPHAPSIINMPIVTPTHLNPVGDKSRKIMDNLGDEAKSNSFHVINQIMETSHDTIALRTWKRLARNNPLPETPIHLPATHKKARELEKGAHPKLPMKKFLVSKDDNTKNLLVEATKHPRQEP